MRVGTPRRADDLYRVCFVCTGNICRSPMGEFVFEQMLVDAGLSESVGVLSAGTGRWHVGADMDRRSRASLERRGYPAAGHTARRFEKDWFDGVDLVVALDRTHRRTLLELARDEQDRAKVELLLAFDPGQSALHDVPDPYFSDQFAFDRVLTAVEQACRPLLRHVSERLATQPFR